MNLKPAAAKKCRPLPCPACGAASRDRHGERGYAVVTVIVIGAVSLAILAGTLQWAGTNNTLNARNNQYFRTVAAAEAATEKVISSLTRDYQEQGDYGNFSHMDAYRAMVPTACENAVWTDYSFTDGRGSTARTYVEYVPPTEFRLLSSQYRGLYGYASSYRIVSNARELATTLNITAGVRQDVEMTTIPVFQFAIFYNMDLEINPGPVMTISGPVHGNQNIYLQPQNVLTFESDVTAAGQIIHDKKPGDPVGRSGGSVVYEAEHDSGVSSLTLPIGTNNSPDAVREVVEIPPSGESATSLMGKQRYYNKADVLILLTDSGVSVKSGIYNNSAITVPSSQYNSWLTPTVSFYNKRESKTVNAAQIDVAKLVQWNQTNTILRPSLGLGDLRIVYVADRRTQTSSTESGVRLVNGQTLLPQGLTLATPNPLYVKGHYNCPTSALGTHNTAGTKPASLIADAVTLLSGSWNDANANSGLSCRTASDTTVNAALLAGIVQTVSGSYSGGAENFPRFLENWSGRRLTYNGSMVVMFPSEYATGLWRGTGSTIGIYNPPDRDWAFDQNFRDVNKLPPGTPQIRALIRGQWAMVRPNSTAVVP
ncbi:MAG: hypothetical protein HZA90_13860 [Verrucomicrobia bacterium]|nr:hypothetical protein [Verrucomicrobiota bacterium]